MSYDDDVDTSMAGWKVAACWLGAIGFGAFVLAAIGGSVLALYRGAWS